MIALLLDDLENSFKTQLIGKFSNDESNKQSLLFLLDQFITKEQKYDGMQERTGQGSYFYCFLKQFLHCTTLDLVLD